MTTHPRAPHVAAPAGRPPDQADDGIEFPRANVDPIRGVADVLRSTLGPMSTDVLLVERLATRERSEPGVPATDDYTVTSDGATVLDSLPMDHPAGELLRRSVGPSRPGETDVEGRDVFDGVTTQVVLAGELLGEAQKLLDDGVHPQDVVRGYASGLDVTHEVLQARATTSGDGSLTSVRAARSAMTGNDVGGIADTLARIAADTAARVGTPDEKALDVTTVRKGAIGESRLVEGCVLDRNTVVDDAMPRRIEDASVLLLGGHDEGGLQDPDVVDSFDVELEESDAVGAFDDAFAARRADLVQRITDAGVDVVVTQLGIGQGFQRLLADAGVMGIRNVSPLSMDRLALATGATVVTDGSDVRPDVLGRAGRVEEVRIEQRKHRRAFRRMVVVDDCPSPESVSVLVRGVFSELAEQATTAVRKGAAAAALATEPGPYGGVVPGGGAIEVDVARAVRDAATAEGSRAQLALDAYADAFEAVVAALASNAGLDPIRTRASVRAAHEESHCTGLALPEGEVTDTTAAGVVDPARVKKHAYDGAVEFASLVLRIDDALDASFERDPPDAGDAIYDDAAERHAEYLDESESRTIWD
jgi:chaperonin GroEL (HSP60 family)